MFRSSFGRLCLASSRTSVKKVLIKATWNATSSKAPICMIPGNCCVPIRSYSSSGIKLNSFPPSFLETKLAGELSQEGKFTEALSLLEHSLAESFKVNGSLHIKTVTIERSIATLLVEMGNVLKADEVCKKAIDSITSLLVTSETPNDISINLEILQFKSIITDIMLERRQYSEGEKLIKDIMLDYQEITNKSGVALSVDESYLGFVSNLGRIQIGLGKFDECQALLRTNLENYRALDASNRSAVNSVGTMKCMDALATCLLLHSQSEKDQQDAEELFRSIYDTYGKSKGPKHRLTLRAAANLGTFLESMGDNRFDEAQELLSRTLEDQKEFMGVHHPDTLITMSYLGELYDNRNFQEEALELWKESMDSHISAYGHSHVDTIRSKAHYAGLLVNMGDYQGAKGLYEQVYASRKNILGNLHPDTLLGLKLLAETHYGLGELESSLNYYTQCLDGLRKLYPDSGEVQYDILLVKGSMGLLSLSLATAVNHSTELSDADKRMKQKEYEVTAFKFFQESCDGFETLHGTHDIHYLRALGNLATYYLTTAAPVLAGNIPLADPTTSTISAIEKQKSHLDTAEGMLKTVIKGMTELLGPEHDYTVGYMSNLAMLLFNEQQKYQEASVLYKRVLEVFVKKYSYRNAKTLTVLYPLSICLAYSGHMDEATHCIILYCEHAKELYGENSAELQAGVQIVDQLRNYKITPSKDNNELSNIYGTDNDQENIWENHLIKNDSTSIAANDDYDFNEDSGAYGSAMDGMGELKDSKQDEDEDN